MNSSTRMTERNLLIIDSDPYVVRALSRILRPCLDNIFTASDTEQGMEILARVRMDIVISDMFFHPVNTIELFRKALQKDPDTVTILLTGYSDISEIFQRRHDGVIDVFLPKPWNNADIIAAVGMQKNDFCNDDAGMGVALDVLG